MTYLIVLDRAAKQQNTTSQLWWNIVLNNFNSSWFLHSWHSLTLSLGASSEVCWWATVCSDEGLGLWGGGGAGVGGEGSQTSSACESVDNKSSAGAPTAAYVWIGGLRLGTNWSPESLSVHYWGGNDPNQYTGAINHQLIGKWWRNMYGLKD